MHKAPTPPSVPKQAKMAALSDFVARRLVSLATLACMALGLVVAVVLVYLHRDERDQAEETGAAFAQVVEEQTARTFQAIDLRLEIAAHSTLHARENGMPPPNSARNLLKHSAHDLDFVRGIWLLDANGVVTDRSDEGPVGMDFSDRPFFQYFRVGTNHGLYIGEPLRSRTNGNWLIHVARPLFDADDTFTGVIVAGIEPLYFVDLWKNVALQNEGSVALWRNDGKLLMRSPLPEGMLGKDYATLPLFTSPSLQRRSGSFEDTSIDNGDTRLFHYRRLSNFPNLIIVVGQSERAIFEHLHRIAAMSLLLWLLMSAVVISFSYSLRRAMVLKRRTAELREQVFERITDAFVAVDTHWRYIYANTHAAAIMQHSIPQLMGKSMWAPEFCNDNPAFRQACESAVRTQMPVHTEIQFEPSGRWFINNIYPSKAGLTIYFRETTEKRMAALQLQTLSRRVLEVQESERRRIAHELHDELGQSLTAIKINLQTNAAFGSEPGVDGTAKNIAMVESALQHVRNLSLALRPSVLDDLGLSAAIEWLVETALQTGQLDIRLTNNLGEGRLANTLETACFRIVQEALTNIQRHANASRVVIDLAVHSDILKLTITDDGKGFNIQRPKAQAAKSLGLLGMRERADLVGGTLTITSSEGMGCQIRLQCPVTREDAKP